MRRGILFVVFIIAFWVVFNACSKGGATTDEPAGGPHVVTTNDTIQPVLEVYSPLTDQVFTNGNNISITGKISDDLGLYRGSVRITNDANGDLIKEQLYEIHGVRQYNFSVSHLVSVTAITNCTVTVFFEDHGLNGVSRSVKIKMNP